MKRFALALVAVPFGIFGIITYALIAKRQGWPLGQSAANVFGSYAFAYVLTVLVLVAFRPLLQGALAGQ